MIEAFPPGTVETYNLNDKGFVSLTKTIRYQEIGGIPFYKTIDSIDGWKYNIIILINISIIIY